MTTANIISAIANGAPAPSASTAASSTSATPGSPDEQPFGALMAAVQAGSVGNGKTTGLITKPAAPVAMQLATKILPGKGLEDLTVPAASPTITEEPVPTTGETPLPAKGEDVAPKDPATPTPAGPLATAPKPAPTPTPPATAVVAAPVVAATGPIHKPASKPHSEKAEEAPAETQDVILQTAAPEPASLLPAAPDPAAPPPAILAAHLAPPAPKPSAEPVTGAVRSSEHVAREPISTAPLAATDTQDTTSAPHGTTREAALPQSDVPTAKGGEQASVPSTTFAQSLPALPVRAAVQVYGGTTPGGSVDQPVVSAQAGQIGHDMGVAIARGVDAGRDALLVRLDPAEMGRVHVRLSFDHDGAVRVAMSAESSTALDMLRREAGDLGRALSDAGVRSDSQSFRFDSGGGSDARQFAQQRGSGSGNTQQQGQFQPLDDSLPETSAPQRNLRSAGGLNLII